MKFKGKIIQIIKEEESKKFGMSKRPEVDYLNIRPNPDFKRKGNALFMICFFVGMFGALFIGEFFKWAGLAFAIIVWGIGAYFLYKEDKHNQKLNQGYYWFFDAPIPINKPHDYKVNDEVEINLEVNKIG